MRFAPLRFLALLGLALLAPLARAHLPLETTLDIAANTEAIEVSVVLSEATARSLLDPAPATALQAAFEENRARLLIAAPSVCTLRDSADTPIPPAQTLLSLNAEGEIRYLFVYPPDVRPASLRSDFLDTTVGPGRFVAVADFTRSPVFRTVLVKGRATYRFASAEPLIP